MKDRSNLEYNFTLSSVPSEKDREIRASRQEFDRLFHIGTRFVVSLLLSLLVTSITMKLVDADMQIIRHIFAHTVFMLLIMLAYRFYKVFLLLLLGSAATILTIIVLNLTGSLTGLYQALIQPVLDFFSQGSQFFFSDFSASPAQINSYALFVGFLFVLLSFLAVYVSSHPWLILTAVGLIMTLAEEEWVRGDYLLFFAAAFSVLLMMTMQKHAIGLHSRQGGIFFTPKKWSYTESSKRFFAALLVTAVIMGAHAVIPRDFFYNNSIDRLISRLTGTSHLKDDTIGYIEFSIAEAGYYPLQSRLGGPVTPSDELFMLVESGPQSFYLRGSVFRIYTGYGWQQDSMEQNWMLNHPRNMEIQSKLLGPVVEGLDFSDDLKNPVFPLLNQDFILYPVADQQVVFNGGRISSIISAASNDDLFIYFNSAGTLYADRQIDEEGYIAGGQIFQGRAIHDPAKLKNFLLGLGPMANNLQLDADEKDAWTDLYNEESLLAFIEAREPDLFALINDKNLPPADKALTLREWVAENINYRLDMPEPPAEQDFIVHVLETKEGYCTYSASLLTVLCRLADIPARYIEGFILPADAAAVGASTVRPVDGTNAHAWTEIFLEEIGWLPIDGTPSAVLDSMTGQDLIPESTPTPEPLEEPDEPEPEPEETDPLEEEPPPDQDEPIFDQAGEDALSDLLKVLGTILVSVLKLLLLLLPLILYYLWRRKVYRLRHDPRWLKKRYQQNPAELILAIRHDLEQIWGLQGVSQITGQTIYQWFMSSAIDSDEAERSIALIEETIYSEGLTELSERDWERLLLFYRREEEKLKDSIAWGKWLFRRFLWSYKHPL